MKPFILTSLLFISGISFAQTDVPLEKGKYIVGLTGTTGFNTGNPKNINYTLSPRLGYFVLNNLATGLQLSYDKTTADYKQNNGNIIPLHNYNMLTPELFVRYYTPRIKIKPYIELSGGYQFQWGKFNNPPIYDLDNMGIHMEKSSYSGFTGSIAGGLRFPVGKKLSIDVGYNRKLGHIKSSDPFYSKGNIKLGVHYSF